MIEIFLPKLFHMTFSLLQQSQLFYSTYLSADLCIIKVLNFHISGHNSNFIDL